MSSAQEQTLVGRVARFFGRGRREQEKGETGISEIAEQIYELEGSPLQSLLIEQNVWKIAKAGDDESELLEYAINALAETSFYAPLEILFEHSEGGAEKIRKLSPEQIIGLADYMANKSFPDYTSIMSLLAGVSGAGPMRDGIKAKIKQTVIDAGFYRRQPVTAMQHALMIDDPEAIGAVFAHLRYEISRSSDNEEVKELEGRLTDVERLKEVSHLNAVSQSDEERKAVYSEWAELNGRVRKGLYEMVRHGSTNPEKAFEAAGDIFLKQESNINNEHRVGDYKHAMECFIASRNPEKILEAVKKANDVVMKESGQMYEAADAAYEGIKAILTCDDIDKEIKQQAAEELKRTFSSVHIYNHNIMQAIEAAEISGDFNILRENFYRSVKAAYGVDERVYGILKGRGEVSNRTIIILSEENLKRIATERMNRPHLQWILKAAELVPDINLDKELLATAITRIGFGLSSEREESLLGFEYMVKRHMLNHAEMRFYEGLREKQH